MNFIRIVFDYGQYIVIIDPREGSLDCEKYVHNDGSVHYNVDYRDECEIATSTHGHFGSAKKALKAIKKAIKKDNI